MTTTKRQTPATKRSQRNPVKMPASLRSSAVARLEASNENVAGLVKDGTRSLIHADGWSNVVTGFGTARDKRAATEFDISGVPFFDRDYLDAIYSSDAITKRVVDIRPDQMMRRSFVIDNDPEGDCWDVCDALDLTEKIKDALKKARLYGTGCILIGADDGQAFDRPLREERIKSLKWLTVLHRFELSIVRRYGNPAAAKFDEPEIYEIRVNPSSESDIPYGARIHESRIVRFDGTNTPKQIMKDNNGFSLPVLQHLFDPIKEYQNAINGISALIPDFAQAVIKIKNLAGMLASDQDGQVIERLNLLDYARSALRMMPLDAENEDFERKATPMAGLADAFEKVVDNLCASSAYPQTLLFGRSPGGLNATGDSDIRFFYDSCAADQTNDLKKPITKLVNLVARANKLKPVDPDGGVAPPKFQISFPPLWTPTDKEQSETRLNVARTDELYIKNGVLDAAEVAVSRFQNGYSMETVLDRHADLGGGQDAEGNEPDLDADGKPVPGSKTPDENTLPADADVEKITALIQQAASGAMPVVAARNVLTVLYGISEPLADRLLNGVEEAVNKKQEDEHKRTLALSDAKKAPPIV